jgi:Transposase IS66 family
VVTLSVNENVLPKGAVFKGYRDYWVQDLIIKRKVTQYRRAFYVMPDGSTVVAELPKDIDNQHFGTDLRRFIIAQYHINNVPQPKIREQLLEFGIQISAGEINNIILEAAAELNYEYEEIREVGLETATNLGVDDTGARHDGKNGSCLVLQNEFFAYFKTTNSKSRENFLTVLRGRHNDYVLNESAIEYIKQYKHKQELVPLLEQHLKTRYESYEQFQDFLQQIGITKLSTGKKSLGIIKEAAILGSAIEHGLNPDIKILSDGANQFNLLVIIHALCWIHIERGIKKLIPANDDERKEIEKVRDGIWRYYKQLKQYKENPNPALKEQLYAQFDEFCTQKVDCQKLLETLNRMHKQKDELLVVLEHPDTPLHNNATESAIRGRRIKDKISGSTRSDEGRQARDIFTTMVKTCRKLGISVWEFLGDRLSKEGNIQRLADLIRSRVKQKYGSLSPPIKSSTPPFITTYS